MVDTESEMSVADVPWPRPFRHWYWYDENSPQGWKHRQWRIYVAVSMSLPGTE